MFETTEIVNVQLDHLIHKCAQSLYEIYLTQKSPGYNCDMIELWQCGVVQQQFLPFDHGESKVSILNKWNEEVEPHYKTIDNMTAQSVKLIKPQIQVQGQEAIDDNKSFTSSKYSKHSLSKFANSLSKVKLINKLGISQQQVTTNSIVKEEFASNIIKMPDTKKPPTPDAIIERLREQREYQELDKQKENERMKKIREEQQEQEEKRKEQQKLLKNKQYTYDYDGQIVFLTTKGVDLQINEILQPDLKTNLPLKTLKEVNSQPEIKPVRETFTKGEEDNRKLEKAAAVEYPKQPSLIEAMKPKLGTNIIFDNGYVKEGGEYKLLDRISKKDYQTMVDGIQAQKKKPQYEDNEDGIIEQLNTYDQKIQEAINKGGDKNIQIKNEQYFKWMMEDEELKRSYRSSSAESHNVKSIQDSNGPSKKFTSKGPEPDLQKSKLVKSKLDRINAYKNFDDMKKPTNLKWSKLHKVVNEFDHKLQNPMWGYAEDKEIPPPNRTAYKLKNQSQSQSKLLPPIKYK